MILVIGAIASGKTTYAKSLGYDESQIADLECVAAETEDSDLPVAKGVDHAVRRALESGRSLEDLLAWLLAREVVICTEVGSGVIPADAHEMEVREQTGRLYILLAREATRVVRMVCGVPVEVKL